MLGVYYSDQSVLTGLCEYAGSISFRSVCVDWIV